MYVKRENKETKYKIISLITALVLLVLGLAFDSTPTNIDDLNKVYVIEVIDGDTIAVKDNGVRKLVRLIGIDSPETNHPTKPVQCYGKEAKEKLTEVLLNKEISMEVDISNVDRYDRLLRYIYLEDQMINEQLVEEGYARAKTYEPDTKYQQKLQRAENVAKSEKVGLWSEDTCGGRI